MTTQNTLTVPVSTDRYAQCIEASKRARWEIEQDVIRGRKFDPARKFLPEGLSKVRDLDFLMPDEMRFLSQVQGRTYANMFGLVERFICAKVMEVSADHTLGDQTALEALVRFSDEELKHQELFRRLDRLAADVLPDGYVFAPDPNDVARAVLSKSTWAVLGLTLHIELFTQVHYRHAIEPDTDLDPLWKDVFRFHWTEEAQHAVMDELEWVREDARLDAAARDQAVTDLIELVGAVDGLLQLQADADAAYFLAHGGRKLDAAQEQAVREGLLKAYRWQYIVSGVQVPRFDKVLGSLITPEQGERIHAALAPLLG